MGNLPKVCLRRLWTYCKHCLIPSRAHSSKKQNLWLCANVNVVLPAPFANSQPQTGFSLKNKLHSKSGAWVWKQTHGSPQTPGVFPPSTWWPQQPHPPKQKISQTTTRKMKQDLSVPLKHHINLRYLSFQCKFVVKGIFKQKSFTTTLLSPWLGSLTFFQDLPPLDPRGSLGSKTPRFSHKNQGTRYCSSKLPSLHSLTRP